MKENLELEKRLTVYLYRVISGYSKDKKKNLNIDLNRKEEFTEEIDKIVSINYYQNKENLESDELDNDYKYPERVFTKNKHYIAMKKVPKIQKEVLYLLVVDKLRIEEVAMKFKLKEESVYRMKKLAIENFKKNLEI